ncbi:MAG: MBL fold metallo-hydrolase, partial [Firmicutes bacterium]|nr:MBL fold metallo-hydrolase [Candidatus Colimorpha enterica]
VVGVMGTNCYAVTDDTKEAIIIDPGNEPDRLIQAIGSKELTLKYIVLTHCHFDHIMAVNELKDHFGASLCYSPDDLVLASDPAANLSSRYGNAPYVLPEPDIALTEGKTLSFGNTVLHIISTPGHTDGSICLINEEERTIFCGDTVFRGCIGRYDFPYGDYSKLMKSVEKLSALDGNYKLLPGHDVSTTLDEERQNSIYF